MRGVSGALAGLLQEGTPDDRVEAMRYREMLSALSWFNELTATMLARWLGEHMDDCETGNLR